MNQTFRPYIEKPFTVTVKESNGSAYRVGVFVNEAEAINEARIDKAEDPTCEFTVWNKLQKIATF